MHASEVYMVTRATNNETEPVNFSLDTPSWAFPYPTRSSFLVEVPSASTALHLSQKGYTNISVFEKGHHILPRFSAASNLTKIVRAEYEDPFYTDLIIV